MTCGGFGARERRVRCETCGWVGRGARRWPFCASRTRHAHEKLASADDVRLVVKPSAIKGGQQSKDVKARRAEDNIETVNLSKALAEITAELHKQNFKLMVSEYKQKM